MKQEEKEKFLSFTKKNGFDISSPDSNQHKAVLCDGYSVLPAGAGSGKTTVLTYRFLRLLMDGIHSDEILTITFTKAATANMRAKIYMLLKKAGDEGLISPSEIDRFSNAEISTTDSFCSRIVRQDCIRYGISPTFTIEDDNDLKDFVESTLRDITEEKIENETECENLLSIISFDALLSLFLDVTHNYINIASPFVDDSSKLFEMMRSEALTLIKDENRKAKEKLCGRICTFLSEFGKYESIGDDTKHAQAILDYLNEGKEISTAFTKKLKVKESPALSDNFKALRAEIKNSFKEYLNNIRYEDEDSFSPLKAYTSLLSEFQRRLIKHKRTEGLLTFHDVILLSIDILKNNYSLRKYYNEKFKRIMVDEFQDNNDENKRLVYLLATRPEFTSEGTYPGIDDIIMDKVFMVGDEKQSIYKFRGADVSVFKNIKNDFGENRVLHLNENFRSEKGLIEKINSIFNDRIMPVHTPDTPSYEAEYTPLLSRRERVKSNISFRYMNAKENDDDEAASNSESEAYEVARIIKEEILGSEKEKFMVYDKDSNSLRSPGYDDIAILLKKTSHQSDFEKALRLFGIPFNVTDNKSLTTDAIVNDFYCVLQYSIYGKDDLLSFASVLRSPFINMEDSDIEKLLKNIRKDVSRETGLSPDGLERLSLLDRLEEEILEKERQGSLTSLIHYLWHDTGYRYYIEGYSRNESYAEHYDYLYAIAADFDSSSKGIVELLDRIRPSLGEVSDFKDLNVLKEKRSGVTIQTIHKSKGLEYPIVFVSDMGGKNNTDRYTTVPLPSGLPLLPYYVTDDNKLKNPLSVVLKKEDNMIENAETKRVLYVAATRSEHHLIFTSVFGKQSFNSKEGLVGAKEESYNSMLQYFIGGIGFDIDSASAIIETREFYPVKYYAFREKKREEKKDMDLIAKWYSDPRNIQAKEERLKVGVTSLVKEDDTIQSSFSPLPAVEADKIFSSSEKREEMITEFGTLVHLLLEDSLNSTTSDTSSFFKDEKERRVIFESAFALKDTFLSSSFYKALSSYSLYPEKEFIIRDGANIVEGIIDLLCVGSDDIIIVDYKTDSIRNAEKHRAQLSYYRKAIETIYPDKMVKTCVFYLRSGECVPIE